MAINARALPKGVKKDCEMCGLPATLECQQCFVTYYCSREHQHNDFTGIHQKLCSYLGLLRKPDGGLGTELERQQRKMQAEERKRELLNLCLLEAKSFFLSRAIRSSYTCRDTGIKVCAGPGR